MAVKQAWDEQDFKRKTQVDSAHVLDLLQPVELSNVFATIYRYYPKIVAQFERSVFRISRHEIKRQSPEPVGTGCS